MVIDINKYCINGSEKPLENDFSEDLKFFLSKENLEDYIKKLNENVKEIREQINKKATLNTWEENLKKELDKVNEKIKAIRKQKEMICKNDFKIVKKSVENILHELEKNSTLNKLKEISDDELSDQVLGQQISCNKFVIPLEKEIIKEKLKGDFEELDFGKISIFKKGDFYLIFDKKKLDIIISGYVEKIGYLDEKEKKNEVFSISGLTFKWFNHEGKNIGDLKLLLLYLKNIFIFFKYKDMNFITYTKNPVIISLYNKIDWLDSVSKNELCILKEDVFKGYIHHIGNKFDKQLKGKFYYKK